MTGIVYRNGHMLELVKGTLVRTVLLDDSTRVIPYHTVTPTDSLSRVTLVLQVDVDLAYTSARLPACDNRIQDL